MTMLQAANHGIPAWGWCGAFGVLGVASALLLVHWRLQRMHGYVSRVSNDGRAPVGWDLEGSQPFAGATWRVMMPSRLHAAVWQTITAADARVEMPPRCSRCSTELEEQSAFWGG